MGEKPFCKPTTHLFDLLVNPGQKGRKQSDGSARWKNANLRTGLSIGKQIRAAGSAVQKSKLDVFQYVLPSTSHPHLCISTT